MVVFLSDSSTGMVDMMINLLQRQDFQFIVIAMGNPRASLIQRFRATDATVYEPKSQSDLMNKLLPNILEILCGEYPIFVAH